MIISTFFSYKGGAGRSTTCFNTIPFMAEEEEAFSREPILLIDMDIESAGMTYLLNQQDTFKGKYDVKQFLKCEETWTTSKSCDLDQHPLYQHFVPVGNLMGLEDDRAVMFLGVDDSSPQLKRKDVEGKMEEAMNKLQQFARNYHFKGIVMDSAAGDQFSAVLAVDTADKIVFCMKLTHQFRIGTFNYLNKLGLKYGKAADEKEIILLPTVVPADAVIDGQSQMEAAINDIRDRVKNISSLDIHTDFISEKRFGINEVMRFKWRESVLYKLSKESSVTADEEEGMKRYRHLAKIIVE
ncbi:MAG: hypothetical protein E7260_00660 [Lachnospiraceae bacterium]|nr:hypothetical protein [Lachnospiraceae bacterium]